MKLLGLRLDSHDANVLITMVKLLDIDLLKEIIRTNIMGFSMEYMSGQEY